jgi:hypothetical protein
MLVEPQDEIRGVELLTELEKTALCVDIRNLITHNRGIVNRLFAQRNPQYGAVIGQPLALDEKATEHMVSALGYYARQLDLRATNKFNLPTIAPEPEDEGQAGETAT